MPSKLKVVLFTIIFFASSTLAASTVIKLDLKGLLQYSDLVVVGTVKSKRSYEEKGRILTSIIVSQERVLKGIAPKVIEIIQIGGKTEKYTTYVPGMPSFTVNERTLLFLEKPKNAKTFVVTGMSQGKFKISAGPDGKTQFVIPSSLGGISLVEKTPALPTLKKTDVRDVKLHEVVTSLDALSERIKALQE